MKNQIINDSSVEKIITNKVSFAIWLAFYLIWNLSEIFSKTWFVTRPFLFYVILHSMKIIGIDYGKKRIGIAVSDEDSNFAFPKAVLENNTDTVAEIKKIAVEEGVEKIVLGESKDFNMKDNPIMKEIDSFKDVLQKDFEVIMHPEVLSSHQAEKMIGEKTKMIDASAAAIILQNYLDSIKN